MHRTLGLIVTVAFAFSLAGTAGAASCKDPATGKFIKCPATAAAPAAAGGYTLDAKGHCHDAKGKMAKKSMCAGQSTTTSNTAPAPGGGATTTTTTSTATASSTGGPHCTKGKRCGNACISVKDVCHKP